jgi:hypothetical protein
MDPEAHCSELEAPSVHSTVPRLNNPEPFALCDKPVRIPVTVQEVIERPGVTLGTQWLPSEHYSAS